jgi:hypothetical protein
MRTNETIKVIPVQIGNVEMTITIRMKAPKKELPDAPSNKGSRLPENIRADIEKRLIAGEKVHKIVSAVGVSAPTIYTMRARLREEGRLADSTGFRARGMDGGLLDADSILEKALNLDIYEEEPSSN